MATTAAKATATLCLVLLLVLQSCYVLHANDNIDPGRLSGAFAFIQSQGFKGSYLALDCSTLSVTLVSGYPDPARSKFQFVSTGGLSYNIRSAQCPEQYIRLYASGGDPFGGYPSGFGFVSVTTEAFDTGARFRPVPQLGGPTGFYALLSDALSYAYLRLSPSGVKAQNGIGQYEQLIIATFPEE